MCLNASAAWKELGKPITDDPVLLISTPIGASYMYPDSELSEIQKQHIRSLSLPQLIKRINYHIRMTDLIKTDENKRSWTFAYHTKALEYAQKVYAEYILTGNDNPTDTN